MDPELKRALDEISVKCNGGYLLDRVVLAVKRARPQWGYMRIRRELIKYCRTKSSPSGLVLVGRYLRLPSA